jgi:hypothetical protein
MIPTPHTYAQWVEVITIFKNKSNDEDVLTAMQSGTIGWQSGVAERFSTMNTASDKFQLDITRARGQEGAIVQAILSLRKEMAFLAKAIDLPVLPQKDRQHYLNLVIEQANNMQKSLEDSARNDRTGKLSSIIRNHKVNSF